MNRNFKPGEAVLCLESSMSGGKLQRGAVYRVEHPDCGGLLVKLEGIAEPFSPTRFERVRTPKPTRPGLEIVRA